MKLSLRVALAILCLAAIPMAATGQNLLMNGDFEGNWGSAAPLPGCVANNWTPWSAPFDENNPKHWSYWELPGDNCTPDEGNNLQRIIGGNINGTSPRGGIYQVITTVPGSDYDLTAMLKFNTESPQSAGYIGYDLTGQTLDPLAATVNYVAIDKPTIELWNEYRIRFTATGTSTAIFIRAELPSPTETIWLDMDNISVVETTDGLINITEGPVATYIGPTTYRIEWTTDIPSDSTVEYDTDHPTGDGGLPVYEESVNDSALTTDHAVVLSGLTPQDVYHYRVKSAAPGYREAVSTNRSFSTPPPALPAFTNGGFELGEAEDSSIPLDWHKYGVVDGRQGPHPAAGPTTFFGVKANEGSYFIASAANFLTKSGGFYQRIEAVPGKTYTVEADYKLWANNPAEEPEIFTLGIDPTGGIDPDSESVVWSQYVNLASSPGGDWSTGQVDAQAQGDAITIFVGFIQKFGIFNITAADNVRVTLPLYTASSIGDARQQQPSTNVDFAPEAEMVVTLVPVAESGFFYMQDADGTAGIRVNSATSVNIGDRVSVSGKLEVLANGELALTNSSVSVTGTGSTPIRGLNNKAVGGEGYVGGTGLSTEGLLVKVWGEVQSFDFLTEEMIIDDGSNVDAGDGQTGLRVRRTGQFPGVGQYVGIVGVVTSDIIDGKKVRVIRGRENMVPGDFETINF